MALRLAYAMALISSCSCWSRPGLEVAETVVEPSVEMGREGGESSRSLRSRSVRSRSFSRKRSLPMAIRVWVRSLPALMGEPSRARLRRIEDWGDSSFVEVVVTGMSMCGAGALVGMEVAVAPLVMMMGWAWPPSTRSCGWKRTGTDWKVWLVLTGGGWMEPVRLRPATMAKLPEPEGARLDPLVVMTFEVTIVEPPLLLRALDEIEKTGPLSELVVVIAVDVSVETPWLRLSVPVEVTTGGRG